MIVKIPECSNPFEVTVNGKKYQYEAGTEVDVPEDVAHIINKHHKEHKKVAPKTVAPFGGNLSWNDLEDKPFYEETEFCPVLDNAPLTLAEDEGFYFVVTTEQLIYEGKSYTVNWKGTDYTCEALNIEGDTAIGNVNLDGLGSNGIPFAIIDLFAREQPYLVIMSIDGTYPETITIKGTKTTIKPLDSKYLPEALQFGEEVKMVDFLEETVIDGFSDNKIGLWDSPIELNDMLEVGNTYTVVYDGVEYSAELLNQGDGPFLGCNYYYPNYNEYPFGITFDYSLDKIVAFNSASTESSHTFAIRAVKNVIKTLDKKFSPEIMRVCDTKTEFYDNVGGTWERKLNVPLYDGEFYKYTRHANQDVFYDSQNNCFKVHEDVVRVINWRTPTSETNITELNVGETKTFDIATDNWEKLRYALTDNVDVYVTFYYKDEEIRVCVPCRGSSPTITKNGEIIKARITSSTSGKVRLMIERTL